MLRTSGKTILSFRDPFRFPVEIDASLLQLLLLIVLLVTMTGGPVLMAGFIAVALILSIYLHEVGHALAARLQGVAVSRIVLHGGGGLCYHKPAPPRTELLIVLAGPLMNLGLWYMGSEIAEGTIAHAVRSATPTEGQWQVSVPLDARLWLFFAQINLFLCLFNMLPVLPLDGGRTFFLGAWYFMPREQAMRVTGLVGTVFAVLWIPAAIYAFMVLGVVLLFFPSIRQNWRRWKGETA